MNVLKFNEELMSIMKKKRVTSGGVSGAGGKSKGKGKGKDGGKNALGKGKGKVEIVD